MPTHTSQETHIPRTADATQTRILLVDDHPAVRAGARLLLDDQPDMRVVAEASTPDEALTKFESRIDVAVVDYHLGDGRDGLSLTADLKRLQPAPRVLIYSAFADGALAVSALIAGADGLLGKHELGQELCRAVRRLARGLHHLPAVTPSVADVMRSRLEPRDQAIFGMLLHGIAPDVIAERLSISDEELQSRRAMMLRALKRDRGPSALPAGSYAPLDYERPRRRALRTAA